MEVTNTTKINKRAEYGGSIPVENVQALASSNMKNIPDRYIRQEIESEETMSGESLEIPVIDMSKLKGAGQPGYDNEMAKLHVACRDWGFFQLINHGKSETIDEMKKVTEEFFKFPLEEKMKYAQTPNDVEGYGQAFVISEEQKLDWCDMLFLWTLPISHRNHRFWPQDPISFRTTLEEYSSALNGITTELMKLISINLELDPEEICKMYENGIQGFRINYYPPCPEADKVIGLTPHSDAMALTLLVQVNEVQGLQIKKNSKWVPVNPVHGSIIVNIGDVMQIMSNGIYKSIEHRAVVDFNYKRLSIVASHNPDLEVMIGPLPQLVKETTPMYKTMNGVEYIKMNLSNKLDGKCIIDQMKI